MSSAPTRSSRSNPYYPAKVESAENILINARRVRAELQPPAPVDGPQRASVEEPPPNIAGLALSGGGIRSATFCLGVLQALAKAGVLLAAEGLHPSSKGARVKFSGGKRTVIDGPFTEAKELIAGFWLWQVKSKEEAIEWLKRCPNPTGAEAEIEIRQVFEAEDFGAEFTPELREQEERLRAQMPAKRS